jgi:hypothetical protein
MVIRTKYLADLQKERVFTLFASDLATDFKIKIGFYPLGKGAVI